MELKFNFKNQISIESIDRFCFIAAILSGICLVAYLIMGIFFLAGTMMFMTSMFLVIRYLNKKKHHYFARLAIIVVTNVGVLAFSVFLGFKSGIFFYLFTTPHLILLLFNFKDKTTIYLCITSYAFTFLVAYFFDQYNLTQSFILPPKILNIVYALNFLSSLIFSFTLVTILANHNYNNINLLVQSNKELEEHQILLKNEIREKETLMSEIHHRVKNNLAVVSGLIELQNMYVNDEKASSILKESRNRIKSIALLHEKFYSGKTIDNIEISPYVDELIYFIKLSFSTNQLEVKIHTQIEKIELTMIKALPFSLLLNELITNSYKHAFKEKTVGNIYISFIKNQNNLILNYKDDGIGFDLSKEEKESSLGMNLITAFSNQLKAKQIVRSQIDFGSEFELQFQHDIINLN